MTTHIELPIIGKVKHPSRWLIGLMAAGVVVIGSTTYFVVNRATPRLDIAALTVPATSKNVTLRIKASGKVVPVQTVNLSPKTSGLLVELLVEQGDRVEQGQIIARMDNADLQAQLIQARANLTKAEAQLAQARAGNRPEEISQARSRLAQAEAQLAQARAGNRPEEIEQARAQVEAAQAKVNLTSSRVQRNRELSQQGAISQDKLDEVVADDSSAKASLKEAQRRVSLLENGTRSEEITQRQAAVAEARQALRQLEKGSRPEEIAASEASVAAAAGELKAVQVKLEDTIIRAPFSGVITQKYATEGAFVTPTTSASSTASATSSSIVAIARGLEVLAQVPEVDIGQIKQGQQVEIVADSFPDQVFKGRVRLISPEAVVEQNVTSFQVRIALVTGQNELRSGMNVDLTVLGEAVQDALLVPTAAIVTDRQGQTGVLIPNQQNEAEFRPVKIGSAVQDQTQIVSGLTKGDRVFLSPPANYKLNQSNER
ncbi:efflux RND transporter periplasmic adaptor subunit [Chroococcidiopsis sp. CCMEE 29]|uniref:efflux RND transporter periplasmic adaptor subunit n=1 Tax=Chroococcidiopsis sp. CCMEE 29 TaxID=155894 RepID=UPI00202222D2|nr:efflux RND transporter periplasmic adaptor subunit [Chroococcidiopsis sp. CCMEE 29]